MAVMMVVTMSVPAFATEITDKKVLLAGIYSD